MATPSATDKEKALQLSECLSCPFWKGAECAKEKCQFGDFHDQDRIDAIAQALADRGEAAYRTGQETFKNALADNAEKKGKQYISVELLRVAIVEPPPSEKKKT